MVGSQANFAECASRKISWGVKSGYDLKMEILSEI